MILRKTRAQVPRCQIVLHTWPFSVGRPVGHMAYLQQECHNSKFGISELLVWKETFAYALVTGIVR
jgi:hypothetical protein